jgi:hypothetical protein
LKGATTELVSLDKDRFRYSKTFDPESLNLTRKWERKFFEVGPSSETEVNHSLTDAETKIATLLALYELCSKIFMSNVVAQDIERYLVADLEEIFDNTSLDKMEDKHIEEIFEEDENIHDTRTRQKAERALLEEGLKSAKRLAQRKTLNGQLRMEPLS